MKRILSVALATACVISGCHRGTSSGLGSLRSSDVPFVGSISQVRDGAMLWVDEESATSSRRGNIFLAPTTEIVMRNGMLVPSTGLRRGMRATVWFRGAVDVTSSSVSGTASRIVVDY